MRKAWQYTVHIALFATIWISEQPSSGAAFILLPLVVAKHHHPHPHQHRQQQQGDNNSYLGRSSFDTPATATATTATYNKKSSRKTALWLAWWDKTEGKTVTDWTRRSKDKKKKNDNKSSLVNITIIGIDDDSKNHQQEETEKVKRRRKERQEDFKARRAAWEAKYGSAEALCRTFGGCSNSFWGDLDGEAARQLYHTLLPRSLWALQEADILQPEELAPLAYQARVAAKEYARLRSKLPSRLLAMAFDGYRSWKRDGNPLNTKGLSWEDLWDKYEAQIVQEECATELGQGKMCLLDRDALTKRIYLRILERSCATNQAFDKMFLTERKSRFGTKSSSSSELGDLATIANQLDQDVREILLRPEEQKKMRKTTFKAEKKREKEQRKAAEQKEKEQEEAARKQRKQEKKEQKLIAKQKKQQERMAAAMEEALRGGSKDGIEDGDDCDDEEEYDNETKRAQYHVLRIAANTRRKLRDM